ncbi:MAG: four helix bundle protein [Ignavibacteriaceae bacterium]
MSFSHQKLIVYQRSLEFIEFTNEIFDLNIKINVLEQLDRASTSIPLNIAEGTGKYTGKDKCRYYDIARGSALECAACLDLLVKRKKISSELAEKGKALLYEIVSMLVGLIKSTSDRVYEEEIKYETANDEQI